MNTNSVSFSDWLVSREALLEKEKAATKIGDELAKARQDMPMVKVEKDYRFVTERGEASLSDLFSDTSQLIVYHFMFGEGWESTCEGCTAWADAFNGTTSGFKNADANLIAISNAPLDQLVKEKLRRNWRFDWVSAYGSDFGVDFYASAESVETASTKVGNQEVFFDRGENHAISFFYKDESGQVFLTYNCFNRGVEPMNGSFA